MSTDAQQETNRFLTAAASTTVQITNGNGVGAPENSSKVSIYDSSSEYNFVLTQRYRFTIRLGFFCLYQSYMLI